jgi:hypothetical protein
MDVRFDGESLSNAILDAAISVGDTGEKSGELAALREKAGSGRASDSLADQDDCSHVERSAIDGKRVVGRRTHARAGC